MKEVSASLCKIVIPVKTTWDERDRRREDVEGIQVQRGNVKRSYEVEKEGEDIEGMYHLHRKSTLS